MTKAKRLFVVEVVSVLEIDIRNLYPIRCYIDEHFIFASWIEFYLTFYLKLLLYNTMHPYLC